MGCDCLYTGTIVAFGSLPSHALTPSCHGYHGRIVGSGWIWSPPYCQRSSGHNVCVDRRSLDRNDDDREDDNVGSYDGRWYLLARQGLSRIVTTWSCSAGVVTEKSRPTTDTGGDVRPIGPYHRICPWGDGSRLFVGRIAFGSSISD